jgi:hypothetical protein
MTHFVFAQSRCERFHQHRLAEDLVDGKSSRAVFFENRRKHCIDVDDVDFAVFAFHNSMLLQLHDRGVKKKLRFADLLELEN